MTTTQHGFRTVLFVALLVLSVAFGGGVTAASPGAHVPGTVESDSAERTNGSAIDAGRFGVAQESGEVNFSRKTYADQRGDVVGITVELNNTDRAVLTVGGDDVGYVANVSISDRNGDGRVTVLWNTYVAASTEQLSLDAQAGTVFETADEADALAVRSVETTVEGGPEGELLEAADYPLSVRGGADLPNFAVVDLERRSTESLDVLTAPHDPDGEIDDESDVYRRIDNGTLTETGSITIGDRAVYRIRATGLSGALAVQNGSTTSERFERLVESDRVSFTINETDPAENVQPAVWELWGAETDVVADYDNDTYFVLVDTSDVTAAAGGQPREIGDGDRWVANFTVPGSEAGLANETQSVTGTFETAERTIDFAEVPYNVTAAGDATIAGSATMAPGTELNVRVRSTGDTQPRFLVTRNATVGSDGRWNATFNFSNQSVGGTFEVTVTDGSVQATANGNFVESE